MLVEIRKYAFYACKEEKFMNEVFLIGKIIKEIEYKFMLEKGKHAKAIVYLELLDKTNAKAIAYNENSDYALQNIKENDIVFVYGALEDTSVIVKKILLFRHI